MVRICKNLHLKGCFEGTILGEILNKVDSTTEKVVPNRMCNSFGSNRISITVRGLQPGRVLHAQLEKLGNPNML